MKYAAGNSAAAKAGSPNWKRIRFIFVVSAILGLTVIIPAYAGSKKQPAISLSPNKFGPGDIIVVTANAGPCNLSGTLLRNNLYFNKTEAGCKAVVGIDLNTEPGTYTMVLTVEGEQIKHQVKVSKKRYPLQRLTLPEDKVTLSPENEARADREQKILSGLWPVDSIRLWNGRFIDPLPGKEITTPFGVRRIINNIPKNSHSGVDLGAEVGEPVKAPNDGVVVLADEQFFSGNSIVLDHGQGIYTMFFHLSEMKVKPGQAVMKGDVIGLVGATGRLTGPCLHWGARVQGAKVDPLQLIRLNLDGSEQKRK